ncbi:MAG: hypothetical protein FWD12_10170, partial [Alphaproteobacteria bacterium]|nr:hypothetical protein [Alphaproteobacteria bacterium]
PLEAEGCAAIVIDCLDDLRRHMRETLGGEPELERVIAILDTHEDGFRYRMAVADIPCPERTP